MEDRTVPTTFMVNTTADVLGHAGGLLSLRQAVIDANANPGPDTIDLPGTYPGTYYAPGGYQLTLTGANEDFARTGDLDIRDDVTIVGVPLVIDVWSYNWQTGTYELVPISFDPLIGGVGDRAFQVFGTNLTIQQVTMSGEVGGQNGLAGSAGRGAGIGGTGGAGQDVEGGCIDDLGGSLTLLNCTISGGLGAGNGGNGGDGQGIGGRGGRGGTARGGAISNTGGTVTIQQSTLASFVQGGAAGPGGVGHDTHRDESGDGGDVLGGVIYNAGGALSIQTSLLEGFGTLGGDSAYVLNGHGVGGSVWGGAIYSANGSVSIDNSNIAAFAQGGHGQTGGGNIYGGGIATIGGTLTITRSLVAGVAVGGDGGGNVQGGGIYQLGGVVQIAGCHIGNGGYARGGDSALGDGGDVQGGGMYTAGGVLTITNSQLGSTAIGGYSSAGNKPRNGTVTGTGLYIASGTVQLDAATVAFFFDIFGPYKVV